MKRIQNFLRQKNAPLTFTYIYIYVYVISRLNRRRVLYSHSFFPSPRWHLRHRQKPSFFGEETWHACAVGFIKSKSRHQELLGIKGWCVFFSAPSTKKQIPVVMKTPPFLKPWVGRGDHTYLFRFLTKLLLEAILQRDPHKKKEFQQEVTCLGGGFNYFVFLSLLGEMMQFD